MGDRFENIKNSTINNRSNNTPSSNSREKKNNPNATKKQLIELVKTNKITPLLEQLENLLKQQSNKDIYNQIILLKSRYSKLNTSNRLGILSKNEYELTENKILVSLMELIELV